MIIDVPTGEDFKYCGIDYLNLAWRSLIDLLSQLKDADYYLDQCYNSNLEESVKKEYWEKSQRQLSTILSLIQQGTEFLLKGHIAEVSPYLLISGYSNYPSKSHEQNIIRFSQFKTIDAQDLIKVFNTVSVNRLPENFQQKIENFRSKRNTIMHSVDPHLNITVKELFIQILEISDYLIAPKSWIETRRKFIKNQPSILEKYWENDDNLPQLAYEIDTIIELLEPSDTLNYFKFDKKVRSYLCPNCYPNRVNNEYQYKYQYNIPTLAQLTPNNSTSTSIYCIICNTTTTVVRKRCGLENCKGNVINSELSGTCLTCGLDESIINLINEKKSSNPM